MKTASATPHAWFGDTDGGREQFRARLARSGSPVLICDYDGTLAPFMADKMQALPYPGVAERLERIHAGATRLVFVSGRPVAELLTLVPLASHLELWGSHGSEQRLADGAYRLFEAGSAQRDALDRAQAALIEAGHARVLERKAASLAVHWRTLDEAPARALEEEAGAIFAQHAGGEDFAVMPFESGLELRVSDRTKADAVTAILARTPKDAAAAYLGDDTTDEDAFAAIEGRGLSLLVRDQVRSSLANYWLRPPEELLRFLDDWLAAVEAGERRQGT